MTIQPVKRIRGMPRGSSRPQLILFSDGRQYIVKFKNNPVQGTRALVNEYVAGRLAQLLGLPVPPFKIVHIGKPFFKENPVLFRYRFRPRPSVCQPIHSQLPQQNRQGVSAQIEHCQSQAFCRNHRI